jgi:hypothetical protein
VPIPQTGLPLTESWSDVRVELLVEISQNRVSGSTWEEEPEQEVG